MKASPVNCSSLNAMKKSKTSCIEGKKLKGPEMIPWKFYKKKHEWKMKMNQKIQMELEIINENVILKKLICCKLSEQKEIFLLKRLKVSSKTGTCFFSFFLIYSWNAIKILQKTFKDHDESQYIMTCPRNFSQWFTD